MITLTNEQITALIRLCDGVISITEAVHILDKDAITIELITEGEDECLIINIEQYTFGAIFREVPYGTHEDGYYLTQLRRSVLNNPKPFLKVIK